MAMLQIRSLPDDVHAALRDRAREEGVPMSTLAARLLADGLSRPRPMSLTAFMDRLDEVRPRLTRDIDVDRVIDEVRNEMSGTRPHPADSA